MVAYWIVEGELSADLDRHLVEALLGWIESEWPLDTVVFPLHTDNARGVTIATELELRAGGPPADDMVRYVWQRSKTDG